MEKGKIKHQERYNFSYFYKVMRKKVKLSDYVVQACFLVITAYSERKKDEPQWYPLVSPE